MHEDSLAHSSKKAAGDHPGIPNPSRWQEIIQVYPIHPTGRIGLLASSSFGVATSLRLVQIITSTTSRLLDVRRRLRSAATHGRPNAL